MDGDDMYDEFGNYLGDSDDEVSDVEVEMATEIEPIIISDQSKDNGDVENDDSSIHSINGVKQGTVVKHTLQSTFGEGVETIISRPFDAMVDEPVIKPKIVKELKVEVSTTIDDKSLPEVTFSRDYLQQISHTVPDRIRNVAIVGGLHSGKTTLVDLFILHTHSSLASSVSPLRYTDNHKLEVDRGLSIKMSPVSLLLNDSNDRSFAMNILDSPGHPNFLDETLAAMHASDGISLVVDVVEGLSPSDKTILGECMKRNLPICVVLNKMDRLVLDLRLPVQDAYYKIRHVLDEINEWIDTNEWSAVYSHEKEMSPLTGNVLFASASLRCVFSLETFVKMYNHNSLSVNDLWSDDLDDGDDLYYNSDTKTVSETSDAGKFKQTFVAMVLEPFYKLITYSITGDERLPSLLNDFGIKLKKECYTWDAQELVKEVFTRIFWGGSGWVDMISASIPSGFSSSKVNGPSSGEDHITTLSASIIKLVESSSGDSFFALVKIHSGSLKTNSKVKILGENFLEDDDDYRVETIHELYLPGGRYRVPVTEVTAGGIALVSGIDSIISKGGWIVDVNHATTTKLPQFPNYNSSSVFKVAVEPQVPGDLPKLVEGFRRLNKAYLASLIKVEESGEHVVFAPGELYMDCMLHDLRYFFCDEKLSLKVSDPMTRFSETCSNSSAAKITTYSPSSHNEISITAEPFEEPNLACALEQGQLDLSQPSKITAKYLRDEHGWDSLSARSLWAFHLPDNTGPPNILLDDTLQSDKTLLNSVKDSISLGFKWSTNEGPLCDEPIRRTKFKILDAVISGSEIQRSGTQIIPMTRKACYAGFMTASPRLMEPVYSVHVTCISQAVPAISRILAKRRGTVTSSSGIPATKLYRVEGSVPVIESFGLETDIRLQTQGQAMCFLEFSQWDLVPGNPLDKDCFLPSLRPVPIESLARDFVMKTRKRKGLSGEPNLQKFIGAELYDKLKESGLIDK
ncbi:pre-mRNA-splicing factor Snu114p [[Candida] anglica]|uniref:Pre-mRNA-splicing factor Snu114p n=1 Tax=[Candida] anglica TaxID=148631 RepID=A0ABP0EJ48_9ASCO